jgi:signal peptidase I
MFIWHWLTSKTVRQAVELGRQMRKYLHAQRDLLQPGAIAALEESITQLRAAVASHRDVAALRTAMNEAENVANKALRPYPHANLRENIDVVLVAIAVALGVRTFFLQPFKIPTGSMQPTLYGITHEDYRGDPSVQFPSGLRKWVDSWFYGISYYHVTAKSDGALEAVEPPRTLFPFVKRQRLRVGNEWYTVWFPPDSLEQRAKFHPGQRFRQGDDIIKLSVKSGDHLFVDRLTYNFRPPRRGEIIVFETAGINHPAVPVDQFYIKRLVAMPEEHVQIGLDQHLIINETNRLDAATTRFENVYTFSLDAPENHYFGHIHAPGSLLGRLDSSITIPAKHYAVMGDNTRSSLDSRYFGGVPQQYVIGKSCFVYWPISERFGWSHR